MRVPSSPSVPARAIVALVALAVLLVSPAIAAHAIGLSRGDYALEGGTLDVRLTFARGDALSLAPSLDADGDGTVSVSELARGRDALGRGVVSRVSATADGAPCKGALADARLTEGDGLVVSASYQCGAGAGAVDLALDGLFDEVPSGHRHLARIAGRGEVVLFRGNGTYRIDASPPVASAPAPGRTGAPQPSTPSLRALSIFRMGVEHILTGYDHLLFLFGLVLVATRWRSLLPVVTAFTIAHSLTLGVAVLGWWTPPSRVVEPLIALSIAYVGVENLFMTDAAKRWRVTFPFGLIHGFGFASALRELDLPAREVPVALVSFNLGVEAGQIAVLALMVPLLVAARRQRWFQGVRVPSLGVAVVGALWFVARIV